jgi:tetratricopeptide (TPR) repeat protein
MSHSRQTEQDKKKTIAAVLDLDPLQESAKALKLLNEFLSMVDPADLDVLRLKGNILDILLKHDQAAKLYERILHLDRSNTLALIDLGDAHRHQDEHHKAIRCYERALRLIKRGKYTSGIYVYSEKSEEFVQACKGKSES